MMKHKLDSKAFLPNVKYYSTVSNTLPGFQTEYLGMGSEGGMGGGGGVRGVII